jgi:hypothetical protein
MKLFVYHDARGRVLSAGKVSVLAESVAQPFAEVAPGHGVLEVPLSAELAALECHEICDGYEVDVRTKTLSRKAARGPARKAATRKRR